MSTAATIKNPNIPGSYFSTHEFPEAEKYAAWRTAVSDVFVVEPTSEQTLHNFETSLESYMLGSMMIAKTTSTSQMFRRKPQNIASHAADYLMIEIILVGSHLLYTTSGKQLIKVGDIVLYDMQQEYQFETQGEFNGTRFQYSDIDFVFPLDSIRPLVPYIEQLHRQIIPDGTLLNTLMKNHLLTIYSQLPNMTQQVVATISHCTGEFIASLMCIDPALALVESESKSQDQLVLIYRLIMEHLDKTDLNAKFFCQYLNLSKSALYRLCEPYGGIMKMVRNRRLRAAYNMLMEPKPPQITQLAMQCGYSGIDSFTRAFKKEFGFPPSTLANVGTSQSELRLQRPDYSNLLKSFSAVKKPRSD